MGDANAVFIVSKMMAVPEGTTSSPIDGKKVIATNSAVNLPLALRWDAELGGDRRIEMISANLASIVFQDGRFASVPADEASIFSLDKDRA